MTMPVIAMTIEPYATTLAFPARVAAGLGLEQLDLTLIERDFAERALCDDAHLTHHRGRDASPWHMTLADFEARLTEIVLETALRGDCLIVGQTASSILQSLSHIMTVTIRAPQQYRARILQKRLHFPSIECAQLELDCEDARCTRLSNLLSVDDGQRPDGAGLVIDASRVSEATCKALIRQMTMDASCTATPTAEAAIIDRLRELR